MLLSYSLHWDDKVIHLYPSIFQTPWLSSLHLVSPPPSKSSAIRGRESESYGKEEIRGADEDEGGVTARVI